MRNLNSFLSIFSFFIFFSNFSCSKITDTDGPLLPPATHSGAGTMGFLLNDKRWVANSNDFKLSSTEAEWSNNSLYVIGRNSSSRLTLTFNEPKTGEYRLENENTARFTVYSANQNDVLALDDPGNKIIISYYDGKIIAGTFSLVFKTSSGELSTITKGRFDLSITH